MINLYSLLRLGEVGVDVLGALPEEALEAVAAPLDGVPNSELITIESRVSSSSRGCAGWCARSGSESS